MDSPPGNENRRCRIVVLISGNGSNLQSFIDAIAGGTLPATIVAVISNKADAFGLERARRGGIATHTIDHRQYENREVFDQALADTIDPYRPDLVILAGFMRILSAGFVQHYEGRLFNIHPSLLPKYPGLNTHQRAIEAGDRQHGATVHFVTSQLDGGPAIIQARIPIQAGDNAETLARRVLTQEHRIYPLAAQWFAEGRLQLRDGKVILDGEVLGEQGYLFESSPQSGLG